MAELRQFNFANFARSSLATAIEADSAALSVEDASSFPTIDPTYDEIFSIILRDTSSDEIEIMYVTAVEGSEFTVERAKEGTVARAWATGVAVVHSVTAAFFEALRDFVSAVSLSAELTPYDSVQLTFTVNAPLAVDIEIYRSVDGGAFALLDTISADTATYEDTDITLPSEYAYYFRVSLEGGTFSDNSNTVTIDSAFFTTFMLVHVEDDSIYEVTGFPAVTIIGDGVVSSAQAKFGTQSFYNPGGVFNFDYARVDGSEGDFVFPGEFTWEGWFYPVVLTSGFVNLFSNNIGFPAAGFIQFAIWHGGSDVLFFNSSAGGSLAGATPVTANAWHHLAITRDSSNVVRMFLDGVLDASATKTGTVGGNSGGVSTFDIGRGLAGDNSDFNGYFEEIRVSKQCRYTANFTPPTEPFPPFPGV